MTNREKFKEVFGIDVRWSSALRPQIEALSSITLHGISCAGEWLESEYKETDSSSENSNKWIWISERLPDSDGHYHVIEKSGRIGTYVFNKEGNSEEYWKRCAIAWQPLSENHENKVIDEHYKKGFANGLRTAEWRYDNAIAEIEQIEINGHIRDVECFRAGVDAALNILNKYKSEESEDEE